MMTIRETFQRSVTLVCMIIYLLQISSCRAQQTIERLKSETSTSQPSEFVVGVQGFPYRANVTAKWVEPKMGGRSIINETGGTIWRNSQGDVRVEQSAMNSVPGAAANLTNVHLFLVSDGKAITWVYGSSTIIVAYLGQHPRGVFEQVVSPQPSYVFRFDEYHCRQNGIECKLESIGQRMINGIPAEGIRYTKIVAWQPQAAGQKSIITWDVWTDSKRDIVLSIQGNDPLHGEFSFQTSNISLSVPNSDLFLVPKGYQEHKINLSLRPAPLP